MKRGARGSARRREVLELRWDEGWEFRPPHAPQGANLAHLHIYITLVGPRTESGTSLEDRPRTQTGSTTAARHRAKVTPAAAPLMLPAMSRRILLSLLGLALPICSVQASGLPCLPCAGLRVAGAPDGSGLLSLLRAQRLPPGSPLFIAWEVALPPPPPAVAGGADLEAAGAAARAVAAAGGTPWLALVFS